ncbi:unnamed protein product [Linum trigynum]|uniref:Uncharacterized protein n=1 Tax=Linum trigynum TaxID=586398 RepID=A0AAV2EPW4_9ROSI
MVAAKQSESEEKLSRFSEQLEYHMEHASRTTKEAEGTAKVGLSGLAKVLGQILVEVRAGNGRIGRMTSTITTPAPVVPVMDECRTSHNIDEDGGEKKSESSASATRNVNKKDEGLLPLPENDLVLPRNRGKLPQGEQGPEGGPKQGGSHWFSGRLRLEEAATMSTAGVADLTTCPRPERDERAAERGKQAAEDSGRNVII